MRRLNILHTVSNYPPTTKGGGATQVVRRVSEELVRRGHKVTVATSYAPQRVSGCNINGVIVDHFKVYGLLGQSILGIYGNVNTFTTYLKETNYDIIMNYAAQTWHTDLTFRNLPTIRAKVVLAACGYSGLVGWRKLLYYRYFRKLPKYLKQYNAVIYHSSKYHDYEFGKRHGITNYKVIPNGIDSNEFTGTNIDFRKVYGITTKIYYSYGR